QRRSAPLRRGPVGRRGHGRADRGTAMTDNDNTPPDPTGLDAFGVPEGYVQLHDWLVMRQPTGDDAADGVAGLIIRAGIGKLDLTAVWTRNGLRKLFDELDADPRVIGPGFVMNSADLITAVGAPIDTGRFDTSLVREVLATLEAARRLAKLAQAAAGGSSDEAVVAM